ncbi:Ferric uptake regulation protein (plasmid) [Variovorax sp. SRS16]|uniref:ferric iron uptake transcriptional regulator n=1 Tax=Variovorax sp. SRS16 TaxID=282217 RepID=UPI0013168845|nr:ferric iron uptake transcriptional regulator [Variovorax sp. SRS16]VTU45209.1 Ferric uptake regulation protein [Variovorax sp. SRS16]
MAKFRSDGTGALQRGGLKATTPRIKVLEIFQRTEPRHLSAEDVYKVLVNEGSQIGLATVYRVLMQLVQAGLLTRCRFEIGKAVFELNRGTHHDHLVCLGCGRVDEFYDAEIEARQREAARAIGFGLQEHALALYGLCFSCISSERR